MLESALTALLRHDDIASHHRGIWPNEIPSGSELPALSYKVITDRPINTIDQTGPRQATVQVNCVASDLQSAQNLAVVVRNTLPTQRGTVATLSIKSIVESSTLPSVDSDSNTHHRMQDFTIHYSE